MVETTPFTPTYTCIDTSVAVCRGLTPSTSIVGKGWQPIATDHRVDEPGAFANPPIVWMRKLKALPGFADDCGRRLLDARGLAHLLGRLRRGQSHPRLHVNREFCGRYARGRRRRNREARSNKGEGIVQ